MNEINDIANQHELISENLQDNVIRELNALIKDIRDERKKQLSEGAKLQQSLQNQIEALIRSKKAYDKAFREAERAVDNFQKADADIHLSRAEVEKQRSNMSHKSQCCDAAKNDYADQLQRTNELQRQHYRSGLPDVFRQLQELDEKRIRNIKNFIYGCAEIERNVCPIINTCLDGIVRAGDIINEKDDSILVIERYKSGFLPPDDFPFEDLSRHSGGSDNGSAGGGSVISAGTGGTNMSGTGSGNHHSSNSLPAVEQKLRSSGLTVKGTITGRAMKKRAGIFNIFTNRGNNNILDGKGGDYSDLAPNQRRKKLKQRVDELTVKIQSETNARDGLMKMKGVYEDNPKLGDPMTIESQLNECSHKLEKLHAELKRYKGYLEDAIAATGGTTPQQTQGATPESPKTGIKSYTGSPRLNGGRQQRSGSRGGAPLAADDESLSRSASDSSVTHGGGLSKEASPRPLGSESGQHRAVSRTSLGESSDQDTADGRGILSQGGLTGGSDLEFYDNIYEPELLPPLGLCKALYTFTATSEGSMGMSENEELHLIEMDAGDGWTRVRRIDTSEEGFVPTSYIEATLFNA